MKKHTKNLCILTILIGVLSILMMVIFLQPQLQQTSGFSVGLCLFIICIFYCYKLLKNYKSKDSVDELEIRLADERSNKIELAAAGMCYIITLLLLAIASFIADLFNQKMLCYLFIVIGSVSLIIYALCYFIYKRLYS